MLVFTSTEIARVGRLSIVLTGENDAESSFMKFPNEAGL